MALWIVGAPFGYTKTRAQLHNEFHPCNESRSKRGALIGRVAREELWVRFKNGAINAKDAEIVCNMTKNIRHEERIEEIQRRCCMLLEKGKGWDYIGAMCQLMANKESVFMKQGLLDFGADFEQDLDRAAKYVELNLSQLNAAIRRMKQGAKLGEKERAQAMRLGIDVSMSEGSEQLLQLLNDMKAKFEYIGSHPDLVASASMWDGKTDPDPVGQMIERAKREREAAEAENEMTDEEWMEKKAREEAAAMTPSLFAMERRVRTSADAIREHVNGADADGKLRTHGLEGLSEDQALKRAFEQAGENLPLLEKLVKVAAEKLGGRAMMRPVNKENGLATKKPSTARDKANRDYGGKIERVVDLIGGTVELPMNGDYAAAVETVQSMLPEGAEVAKVKKLGFTTDAPSYKDVKVSVRFPNGGIGEIIIVDAFVNDAKFNRGGHVIYEIVRELEPYKENNANVAKALEELKNLSSAVYDHFTDEASLERAKSSASSALEGLQPDLGVKNFLLSSSVADIVKSPELMSKVIKPASVVSTATPSFSLIQNISGDDVAQNGGNVNTKNSFAMTADKNLAAVHSLSPEKFLAAVELGGMPMPSVAITRLDRPYEWGGEGAINLIGKPEMVDPKKRSKVYMHDAYTGTMPPVKYKRKNAAAAERLKQDALEKLAVYGMGESDGLRRGIFSEDEEVVDGDAADWGYNRAMMAYWAITQAGYAPRPKMTEKPGQMSKDKHSALKPWVAKLKKKDMRPEDFTAEELEEFRGLMVAYYEGKKLRGAAKEYREMEAWRLARCAREEADKVRNYSTAKVPDGLENGKRFYEYAKKHAKAYSAWCRAEAQKYLGDKMFQRKYERRNWRGDVVDEWWGHEKYTLGNVLKYLRENKARGEEMSSITPGVFLAGVAEEMRNMREIGWARERVVGAEEYKKAKDEYEEAFSAFYDKACEIGREAGGGYFDLADAAMYNLLELVQGGKRMPARESVARALEQSGGKWTEDSVDAAMHLLDKALGMPSDYMEAVPQRAVNMSEWEYAVLPKGLKKNKEVTEALKANGIKPIWHDGTEEGRKAALAGLVNEPTVSFQMTVPPYIVDTLNLPKVTFNLIGPKAATWDKYAERSFKGRDDGMQRAEIDASKAKLVKYDEIDGAEEARYKLGDMLDYPELYEAYPWMKDKTLVCRGRRGSTKGYVSYDGVIHVQCGLGEEKTKQVLLHELQHVIQDHEGFALGTNTSTSEAYIEKKIEIYEKASEYLQEAVDEIDRYNRAKALIHNMLVLSSGEGELQDAHFGLSDLSEEERKLMMEDLQSEYTDLQAIDYDSIRKVRGSTWKYKPLPEPQYSADGYKAMQRELDSMTRTATKKDKEDYDKGEMLRLRAGKLRQIKAYKGDAFGQGLYFSSAGEVEARTVEARMNLTEAERIARDVYEENEYVREAKYGIWTRQKKSTIFPFDLESILEEYRIQNTSYSMTRGAEDALEILRKRETEREGERLIREWQKQCELWSKLGGTDDAKIGRGSRIFGEMMALVSATKGVLPPEYTRMRGLGMSLQWAEIYADMANKGEVPMRGVMKGSIYDKFVSAIEKRREKDMLHGLTAEDAAENLKELAGRKLENIMQTVAETCRRHLESYLKNRERVRLEKVAGAAMPKEEPGKKTPRGKVAADIVRQVRNALELMDKERNEVADIIDDAREGLNRLDPDDPEYAAKEEMLHEQAYMAKTFGNWDGMTLEEARAAADAMAQIVSNGRAAWKDKLDRERRHIKYIIGRVSRNFRVPLEEYQGAGAMRDIAEKSRGGKMLGKLPLNLMSFADLMLALRPVLGKEFCDAQRAKLAEHHIRMQAFGNRLRKRMLDTAARITGMKNERDLAGWINGLNQEEHTGIHRREKVEHSVVLTIEDAQRWLDMSELQRNAERERLKREAEEAELAPPTDIPTEEHIGLLQEELNKWQAKDEDARAKQKYLKASVTTERDMGEIVATKEGITPRGCRCSVSGRGESHHLCIPRIPWTPAQSR